MTSAPAPSPHRIFSGYGIEAEYMIVDAVTLDVKPIADQLLRSAGGGFELEVERGGAAWSNELALHVIEMKTAGISRDLAATGRLFQAEVEEIDARLRPFGARLLPGGMHPWMRPERELVLWPHENDVIYQTFDRIFDCRGHGWANLQSVHINLPFADDAEFARLHAAIRLVLPLLPALAASSPFVEGRLAPALDYRVEVYRHNAARVPSVSGRVVPERCFSRAAYEGELLAGIYRDLAPHDPEGVLAEEWVNARGAIARFDRSAIEIRLLDTQECPTQDLAIVRLVTEVVRALAEGRFAGTSELERWDERDLEPLLVAAARDGSRSLIEHPGFLGAFGLAETPIEARTFWQYLATELLTPGDEALQALDVYFREGTLAERLVAAAGSGPSSARLRETYGKLADCLAQGRPFSCESA